jgi:hypothetical protein
MSVKRYFTSEHGFSHYDKFAENYGIYACISIFLTELLFKSFKIILLGNMLNSFLITVQTVVTVSNVAPCTYSTYGWQSIVDPSWSDDTNLFLSSCLDGDPNSLGCDAIVCNVGKNYVSCADKFPSTCATTSFGAYCSVLPANNYNTPYYWCTVKMNNIWTAGFGLAVVALASEGLIILICLVERFGVVNDGCKRSDDSEFGDSDIVWSVIVHSPIAALLFLFRPASLFKQIVGLSAYANPSLNSKGVPYFFIPRDGPQLVASLILAVGQGNSLNIFRSIVFAIPTVTTVVIFIGKIWYGCVKEDLLQNKLLP